VSNPPILAAAPLLASLALFGEAGMASLRRKSVELSAFLERLVMRLPGVQIITPKSADARGCQMSLRLNAERAPAERVFQRLTASGAVCDWREPDVVRVAPVPLYNSFEDVRAFAERLERALKEGE
ncbi:MAG TPA: hypothetical protein VJ011_06200, partial [Steroidobacteraceae bacterium]|nr:hypothetical protein [Steroidobacteraceae bacterium]